MFERKGYGVLGNDGLTGRSVRRDEHTFGVFHQIHSLLLKYVQLKRPLDILLTYIILNFFLI